MAWMSGTNGDGIGTKWGFLVAGSREFENYRHQADVCHAYHVLKDGGLRDENIIVMMYDDIAFNSRNPSPGHIYNKPNGPDVYAGVPKDYTGKDVNVQNIFNIIRGDGTYLSGGSGKVLKTGPEDTIFIYFSGHGGERFMDIINDMLWGEDLVGVLIKKRESNSVKKMVIYIEACQSGSMFDAYLKDNNTGIYATTASDVDEPSYPFYCPNSPDPLPFGISVCIGDLYSITWMEDSESLERSTRTLQQQWSAVNERADLSYVMQYGDMNIVQDTLDTYMGANTINTTTATDNKSPRFNTTYKPLTSDEAKLLYLKHQLKIAPNGTKDHLKAQKDLDDEIAHRKRDDRNVMLMWKHLFGKETSSDIMLASIHHRAVDETNCLKMLTKTYKHFCGTFSIYGLKYVRAFAHMCSAGFSKEQMIEAVSYACPLKN
ncbi:legumain [Trifolium repens]|nr:legumain [Trifolium repens]